MVVFTCNHCGESVKKTAVEKHYGGKCRSRPVSVSCMDCMKDFYGTEYVAHIKCITEAEKYSGKDYVPKDSQNAGQKKQDSWMETVRSILTTSEYNLTSQVRGAFQRLEAYDNVPRKKAKFENFIKNCLRLKNDEATQVWKILEKEIDKTKQANAKIAEEKKLAKNATNGQSKQVDDSKNIESREEVTAEVQENGTQKKEKKSSKRQLEEDNSVGDSVDIADEPVKKNKSDEGSTNAADNLIETVEEPVKKKKAKKSKDKDVTTTAEENSVDPTESVKEPVAEAVVAEVVKSNVWVQSADNQPLFEETNGKSKSVESSNKFEWCATILKEAAKNSDGIPIDKLRKKVLKKYFKKTLIEIFSEKQERKLNKTFNKYLKKCNLKLENDMVKTL